METTKPRTRRKMATNNAEATEENIRQRAYEIYQERGGTEGNPEEDWLRAERELSNR